MVHLILLQNKSAELVVSLAHKRKRDRFKPIACADRETRKQLVKFNINLFYVLMKYLFCDNCSKYHIFF